MSTPQSQGLGSLSGIASPQPSSSDIEAVDAAEGQALSAAIAWIHAMLRNAATSPAAMPAPLAPAAPQPSGSWLDRLMRRQDNPETRIPASVSNPATPSGLAPVPAPARPEMPHAIQILTARFGLSRFEEDVLLLVIARELHTSTGPLCAEANRRILDQPLPHPTFALAMVLFEQANWSAASHAGALRHWRLLSGAFGEEPILSTPLRVDERILSFIKGVDALDGRLAPLVRPVPPGRRPPDSQAQIAATIAEAAATDLPAAFVLTGHSPAAKLAVAAATAERLRAVLYEILPENIPLQPAEADEFALLWRRESALAPVALYIDGSRAEPGGPQRAALNRILGRRLGLVLLDSREGWRSSSLDLRWVPVGKPSRAEQQASWQETGMPVERAQELSAQFDLDESDIQAIAADAGIGPAEEGQNRAARVWNAALDRTATDLEGLAVVLKTTATWDDLVLPPTELNLLRQLADQVHHGVIVNEDWGFARQSPRGLGVTALFAGSSGTGKTLAAEVLATELNLRLCRVDLASVVSKYIGETEKNLRALFDAADAGGIVLFFDEADALFGKRSEVKDSHDRYANIEIDYLLQRMEAFRGLAILATNKKSALDAAFLRRLRFVVDFPFPNVELRMEMWKRAFPPATPTLDLDWAQLAKLNLTGGSIHSVAVNAAFLAARSGQSVSMPMVLEAARTEFRKLEKPVPEADFRWTEIGAAR